MIMQLYFIQMFNYFTGTQAVRFLVVDCVCTEGSIKMGICMQNIVFQTICDDTNHARRSASFKLDF